jgi:hypothetical protein
MVGRINRAKGVALSATLLMVLSVTACGGQSQRQEPDDGGSGGTGGSGAAGSSGATGGSGAAAGSGATGGTGAGGSGATAGSGATGGTGVTGGCIYDGTFYRVTARFPATDGCNTCTCESTDTVVCTRSACLTCNELPERFETAMLEAKRCDPRLRIVQCTVSANSALQCGCPTYVNDDTELKQLASEFQAQACGGPILCGACPDPPVAGRCSEDYVCVDEFENP